MVWHASSAYKRLYKLDAQLRKKKKKKEKKDAQPGPRRSKDSGPLASASGSNTAKVALHNGVKSAKYLLHPDIYVAKLSHGEEQ